LDPAPNRALGGPFGFKDHFLSGIAFGINIGNIMGSRGQTLLVGLNP
jgi:hypothetical protein